MILKKKEKCLKVGDSFLSYKEFQAQLEKYCEQEKQFFVIRDNTKCTKNANGCKRKICNLKEGIIYHDVVLECKHGVRRHKSIQKKNQKK